MKKTIKTFIFAALLAVGVATPFFVGDAAFAVNPIQSACSSSGSASSLCEDSEGNSVESVVQIIVNVLLFIIGLISVIMIIVGGLRYATSGGNASSVSAAKNTILYAVIGLAIALFSFAIVSWVTNTF